jgi:hypothetical protein
MTVTATMPSIHQWLAVIVTTSTVTTGCASTSHRHLLELMVTTAMPMSTAHSTCTDGIAESWSAMP